MSSPQLSVAFLGLGLMGSRMARRIVDGGFPLRVFNRDPAKAAALVGAGAQSANTAREAAGDADVVVSMVADDLASRQVWLGESGALSAVRRGAVLIECSTVTPGWIRELAAEANRAGCALLDAPVTGSRDHAAAGELAFLVGGASDPLQTALPVLRSMGRSIIAVGPSGSGAMLKLINNFICGVEVAALAEAIAMVERSGLDRHQAIAILTGGAGGSPLVKTIATRMLSPDYTPHFPLHLMAKDLVYADREARQAGFELATAQAALARFRHGVDRGLGEKDIAAVIEPLRQAAGNLAASA